MTLVYQHELPNVPGKSIKGVLVEYGPGGYSPGHTHAKSAFGVSASASETQPTKLLAVFVVDTNETVLTAPFGN